MIELSITAKTALAAPPVTAVPGAVPGGFARALDAIVDGPPPAPVAVATRQGDAAAGKELPAMAAVPAEAVLAAPAMPTAKAATARRQTKTTADIVPPIDALLVAPINAKPASPDPDQAPADDAATSDADKPAPIATFVAASVAPIMIDPSLLPACSEKAPSLARGDARPMTVSASLPAAPAAPIALDPGLAATPAPDAPPVAPAPNGTTALPVGVELIDAGVTAKIANAPADPAGATAPRIAARTTTPRFIIAPATIAADPATMAVQPARQAFAIALAALSARAPAHDDDASDPDQPIVGFTAPTSATLLQAAVQQVADSGQSALDPRHDRGLHGMIDHIEMLRDDANARDTRIRLTPDALGTVDVALRRDGEAVHVRFSSANEATRLVLNDAQPRLTALAEARGVRLAGSSIDSGTGGGGGNQPQPQPRTDITRPARAARGVATTDGNPITDQRLA